jgi:hypothetical protein
MAAQYGYASYYKPPRQPSLAQAASAKDPYGLSPNNRSGPMGANPLGLGSGQGFATSTARESPLTASSPAGERSAAAGALGLPRPYAQPGAATPPATPPTAPTTYDLNTDPALQQILALAGLNNQQAQAEALKERQNLLLQFGDPNVTASVLGQNDPLVQAAQQNPTSTVNQLGQQRDQNLKTLIDQLNPQNLDYSGYRITQEQQNAQNYQNALAQAAAGLNSNLGQVDMNLNQQLSANNAQIAQGYTAAEAAAAAAAAAAGNNPGAFTQPPPDTSGGQTPNTASYTQPGTQEGAVSGSNAIPPALAAALRAALGIGGGGYSGHLRPL